MAITHVLAGARPLDQLREPTLDGHGDENAQDNCVATSVAEGLSILTGRAFVADQLKDAVYGQGYVGVMAPQAYVRYCADHGARLAPIRGTQAQLLAAVRQQVAAGHPVVITMPSHWATVPGNPEHPTGGTHVGLAVGIGPDAIRVMNPWHGFMQDASDAWWRARLCEGEVWAMEPAKADQTLVPPGQPTGYYGLVTTSNSRVWHCPSTGQDVALGYLSFYRGLHGPDGVSATQLLGLPISAQYKTADGKIRQDYERGSVIFDGAAQGAWRMTLAPIGTELATLREQLAHATRETSPKPPEK
ncbi:MAG TPA: hypothetical protein VF812_03790 [Ktedonobacterales bacterium]